MFIAASAIVVSSVLLAATSAGATTSSTFMRWKFASDLRAHPNENPLPSPFGKPAAWSLRQSRALARDGDSSLLSRFSSTFHSRGLEAWHGDQSGSCGALPAIGVNTTGKSVSLCTAHVPADAAFVLPSASRLPVVAWTSPYDGTVTISHDAVADLDPTCGDGVTYSVTLGVTQLSAVTLRNGGAMTLPSMDVAVRRGQSLDFIVDPGPAHDIRCDATQLQITVDGVVTRTS